jgi:hypothetical protein
VDQLPGGRAVLGSQPHHALEVREHRAAEGGESRQERPDPPPELEAVHGGEGSRQRPKVTVKAWLSEPGGGLEMCDATEIHKKYVDGDADGKPKHSNKYAGRILSNPKRGAA